MLQAQTDRKDEKRNVKQPPKLVILDDTQRKSSSPQDVLEQVYNLGDNNQLTPRKQSTDNFGFSQQEFQQRHQGIPVEFAITKLHSKQGTPQAVSGEYYPIKDLDVSTTLTNQQALMRAVNHIGAQHYLWEYPDAAAEMDGYQKPTGDLVILPMYNGEEISTYKVAYKFDIYATYPISRGDLYIDAKNGEALFYNATIKHADSFGHVGEPMVTVSQFEDDATYDNYTSLAMMASGTAATRYSGSRTIETQLSGGSYRLADTGRDVYTRDAKNQAAGGSYSYINNYDEFTDNNNNWTTAEHSANKDNAALDAHWGAMETYDYWQEVHGRDSYNGSGAQIRSYVHVDNNYDNAFWNGSVMSYGDGSSNGNEGNGYFDALTSIDVAAHEIGHAVTTFTADLAYQRESGGLNC
jgi:Zn-dependent metalloprotease